MLLVTFCVSLFTEVSAFVYLPAPWGEQEQPFVRSFYPHLQLQCPAEA